MHVVTTVVAGVLVVSLGIGTGIALGQPPLVAKADMQARKLKEPDVGKLKDFPGGKEQK